MANRPHHHFAICVCNDGYSASLEMRKLYEVLPDRDASQHGQLRVIDESGEDYLYPESFFVRMTFSKEVEEALVSATRNL